MPGLTGFLPNQMLSKMDKRDLLQNMQSAITHHSHHRRGPLFCNPKIFATCVQTGIWKQGDGFYTDSSSSVWLDGEFFNQEEIANQFSVKADTDAKLLLALFNSGAGKTAIQKLNGIYAAAVFDSKRDKLYLFNDRYGLRPLFWTRFKESLAWASETKALQILPGFTPILSLQALEEFLGIGFILGNKTWFKGIERFHPASYLTFNFKTQNLKIEKYWYWNKIHTQTGKLDIRELAEELGNRFIKAVEIRSPKTERTGLVLSGGLDSRAILAAMENRKPPIQTLTFGQKNSLDIQIARKVATLKGARNEALAISAENWLLQRIAGVWWTDGLLDLFHMHGIENLDRMSSLFDICLNGAGGDGIVGGSHLFEPRDFPTYIQDKFYISKNSKPTLFSRLKEEFSALGTAHAFYVHCRIQSFTLNGPRLGLFQGVEYRLPFLDYKFQDFLYSIPISFKKNNRLYKVMLLNFFPEYYRKIPWQNTGKPISWPNFAVKTDIRLKRFLGKLRMHHLRPSAYTDYQSWIHFDPAISIFKKLLLDPKALCQNYISKNQIIRAWEDHLNGVDRSKELCRYLTFELHLQQVFEGRWREGPE